MSQSTPGPFAVLRLPRRREGSRSASCHREGSRSASPRREGSRSASSHREGSRPVGMRRSYRQMPTRRHEGVADRASSRDGAPPPGCDGTSWVAWGHAADLPGVPGVPARLRSGAVRLGGVAGAAPRGRGADLGAAHHRGRGRGGTGSPGAVAGCGQRGDRGEGRGHLGPERAVAPVRPGWGAPAEAVAAGAGPVRDARPPGLPGAAAVPRGRADHVLRGPCPTRACPGTGTSPTPRGTGCSTAPTWTASPDG